MLKFKLVCFFHNIFVSPLQLSCAGSLAIYASPILIPVAIRRGWLSVEGGVLLAKFIAGVGLVVACALLLRGASRWWRNPAYAAFLEVLQSAQRNYSPQTKVMDSTAS